MIDLIVLTLLVLLAIYAHKKHEVGEKLVTKPIRFFIFPVHWWLRDAIFKFTGSNLITGIVWLFAGIFIFLLFISVTPHQSIVEIDVGFISCFEGRKRIGSNINSVLFDRVLIQAEEVAALLCVRVGLVE